MCKVRGRRNAPKSAQMPIQFDLMVWSGEKLRDQCVIDRPRRVDVDRSLKFFDCGRRPAALYTIHDAGFEALVGEVNLHRPNPQVRYVAAGVAPVEISERRPS